MTDWRPLDCHAHSTCSDGGLRPDDVIAAAAARGVRGTVSDHVSHDVTLAVHSVDEFDRYMRFIGHLPYRAAEFCSHDTLWRELTPEQFSQLTHSIGSLHAVTVADGTLVRMFQRTLPDGLTTAEYMAVHVTAIESLADSMPVDIFAHPTLVPHPLRSLAGEELWSEADEERLVRALARSGIAFEISNRYRPHRRLVARAVAAGVRISLGSDGHYREQIGDLEWPLALARSLGVADADLYDPLAHGTRRD